jgi:hypothetical protein
VSSIPPKTSAVAGLSVNGKRMAATERATPKDVRNLYIVVPFFRELVTG